MDAERFSRQLTLPGFGAAGQRRLEGARVLVLGAGGLGSAVLPILAGAGVGVLGVVDDDVVELSNLHRQLLHTTGDVGRLKVESAADRLAGIATGRIEPIAARFTDENAAELAQGWDVLVDGSDNFATRYLANDTAVALGIPLVWGALAQYGGHVGAVPVGGPDYRDLFPDPPDPSTVITCADGGVLPSVCGVIGSLMATEILKLLTGLGEPLAGRILSYDALPGRFREVPYRADPDRPRSAAPSAARPAPAPEPDADEVSAVELARLLEAQPDLQLVDVREPWEAQIAILPGARLHPLGLLPATLEALDRDAPVVAYCHHGVRSERALEILRAAGFDARHLAGGIDAWSRTVDPALPRY